MQPVPGEDVVTGNFIYFNLFRAILKLIVLVILCHSESKLKFKKKVIF